MCSKGSVTAVLEPIKCINCINLEFYWGFRQIVEPQTVFSRMSRATRDQAARPGSVLMEINGYNSGLNCKTPHTLHQGVVGFFNFDIDTVVESKKKVVSTLHIEFGTLLYKNINRCTVWLANIFETACQWWSLWIRFPISGAGTTNYNSVFYNHQRLLVGFAGPISVLPVLFPIKHHSYN